MRTAIHAGHAPDPGRSSADEKLRRAAMLHRKGDFTAAIPLYRELVAAQPRVAGLHNNLGAALLAAGEPDGARQSFEAALEQDPGNYEALINLSICYEHRHDYAAAAEVLQRAIALVPDRVEAFSRLGLQFLYLKRDRDAAQVLEVALKLNPDQGLVLANLAAAYSRLRSPGKAAELSRRALIHLPHDANSHNNLANCLKDQGAVDEALPAYRRALQLLPDSPMIRSNILLALNYSDRLTPEAIASEHFAFGDAQAELALEGSAFLNDPDPQKRLRVGYVSPDFRQHSVAYFIQALLREHDPARIEVYCYSCDPRSDQLTTLLRSYAARWSEVHSLSDEDLARKVRDDQIDILVDLAGHTAGGRPGLFARRAAPVQLTYVGYPNTTGLRTMDYRITDAVADPEGMTEHLHTEQLVRIPGGFLCYTPPDEAVKVSPPPSLRDGRFTFGSLNVLAKLTDRMIATWSEILCAVPRARLLLKSGVLDEERTCERIRTLFERNGVDPERLDLIGFIPQKNAHLRYYQNIDVALDPYPYNGTTTTCEALWMGVPVVTLAGESHPSRVGASLLSAIGHSEWIARSRAEYVEIAVGLAADPARLASVRFSLRHRMSQSPLMDGARIACEMEVAYRRAWRQWCTAAACPSPTALAASA